MIEQIVDTTIFILILAIVARSLLTFFPVDPRNVAYEFLYTVTEPILRPLRHVVPRMGMLDLTPMAAVFILFLLRSFVSRAFNP